MKECIVTDMKLQVVLETMNYFSGFRFLDMLQNASFFSY